MSFWLAAKKSCERSPMFWTVIDTITYTPWALAGSSGLDGWPVALAVLGLRRGGGPANHQHP
jgi:hypothetical protein